MKAHVQHFPSSVKECARTNKRARNFWSVQCVLKNLYRLRSERAVHSQSGLGNRSKYVREESPVHDVICSPPTVVMMMCYCFQFQREGVISFFFWCWCCRGQVLSVLLPGSMSKADGIFAVCMLLVCCVVLPCCVWQCHPCSACEKMNSAARAAD